jgi:hypothetical protein
MPIYDLDFGLYCAANGGDHNAIIAKLNHLTALERVSLVEWIEKP